MKKENRGCKGCGNLNEEIQFWFDEDFNALRFFRNDMDYSWNANPHFTKMTIN